MKGLTSFAVFACCLSLGACQLMSAASPAVQAKTFEFNLEKNCPDDLNVHVGDVIVFSAPENASTGYQWSLVKPLNNFKTEESYLQNHAPAGIVGVGGVKSYRFTAVKSGQADIQLAYSRAWENKQPASQWQCRVTVSAI